MIVKTGDADRFAARPPQAIVAALFYGPDEGLVRERAATMAKTIVPDLADPFRVAEISEESLSSDPARLFDEAAAISMLGGRRVIRVRGAGNNQAALFERLLEERLGDTLVVVEAGELAKSGSLRKVFEEAENGAAIACYADNERDRAGVVRAALKERGLDITADALAQVVDRLGADRGITRQELEKLALYAQGAQTVTAAHVAETIGDESELKMDQACDSAGEGDYASLDSALGRLWAAGVSPVAVLRLGLGHFQKLALVRAEMDDGGNLRSAMMKLRPPLHFSRTTSFEKQVSRFSQNQLQEALARLYEGEVLTKTTAVPAEAAASHALFSICRLAAAPRR